MKEIRLCDKRGEFIDTIIKKALCAGLRGHKNKDQDLQDILDSAKRAVELND